MLNLPPKKNLAVLPTPLKPMDRLSEIVGGPRIWLKRDDLTGSVLSGNKIRKLEYIAHEVEQAGIQVLITCGAWNSNHCRATAYVAAELGLRSHLILRDDGRCDRDGNLLLSEIAGAQISVYPQKQYVNELPKLFSYWEERYQTKGFRCRAIPTGGSDGSGVFGYLGAVAELLDDFSRLEIDPKFVFCASGSGGTQAGLTLGFSLEDSQAKVIGVAVCDSAEYFNDKVIRDILDWRRMYSPELEEEVLLAKLQVNTWDSYIGPGYAKEYPEVIATIKEVASVEGVLLDPIYTGKAFWGMLDSIRSGKLDGASDIVFVHTGGGFGVFPYRASF